MNKRKWEVVGTEGEVPVIVLLLAWISANEVWPEPFIENLAYQVAVNASRTRGRLAAAPAISNLFQVCSTWRAISRSNPLWRNLTRQIWGVDNLVHNTWRDEYVYRHCTAYNFRISNAVYTRLNFDDCDNNALACRCLALSDLHLACGFDDGSVRLFDLSSRLHVSTFHPHQRDRLGPFSRAVSGIILTDSKLVFASLDGDIHVVIINGPGPRRAHLGNMMIDGTLVDFTGCRRWWVGLYAAVPGRSFHVWDDETEELVFVGGTLTDPEALLGWRLLTELTEPLGRVRVSNRDIAVACTGVRVMAFDLQNLGLVLNEEEVERGVVVSSVDVSHDLFLVVDNRRVASVRRVDNFEEVCTFTVRGGGGGGGGGSGGVRRGAMIGCINGGCIFICTGGIIRVWDVQHGQFLYNMSQRIGDPTALIANERHVAASSSVDATIHLWDYSAI
ncbi:WD40 repeat [Macleaya cordata]|uniref:WD40 repeat n=1 Tax=Macleaya cordata TaxID=56857 RepID=A0A200RBR1_MACCD|nr:WD40 repeat [Macleaya cordata]